MGLRFYLKEEFISWLKMYTDKPYFWLGFFHREIAEVWGKRGAYYIRSSLHALMERLGEGAETVEDVHRFVEGLDGVQLEDRRLIADNSRVLHRRPIGEKAAIRLKPRHPCLSGLGGFVTAKPRGGGGLGDPYN